MKFEIKSIFYTKEKRFPFPAISINFVLVGKKGKYFLLPDSLLL